MHYGPSYCLAHGKHSLKAMVIMVLLIIVIILTPMAAACGSVTHGAGRQPHWQDCLQQQP